MVETQNAKEFNELATLIMEKTNLTLDLETFNELSIGQKLMLRTQTEEWAPAIIDVPKADRPSGAGMG